MPALLCARPALGSCAGRAFAVSFPPAPPGQLVRVRIRWYATEAPLPGSSQGSSNTPRKDGPPRSDSNISTSTQSSSSKSSSTASSPSSSSSSSSRSSKPSAQNVEPSTATDNTSLPPGWENETVSRNVKFSELPHENFGFNQHMVVNDEFKEALRGILWQFRAPIRYAFAYGSGVFSQRKEGSVSSEKSPHPHPPEAVTKWQKGGAKNIDFIFGVSYSQHWHSLNLQQNRNHYSFLGALGSNVVTKVQENFGAGAYFNAYVVVNGIMIKYGVVNLDALYRDLSDWDTLYFAGRLHKPVKILRDDPRIRLANQKNLISALRTALLMLPPTFTERELYTQIASLSYMGDPRMAFRAENPRKVADIVDNQMVNFRQLYLPLIDDLPNISFNDFAITKKDWVDRPDLNCKLEQDMNPQRRGNMVRRLPKSFRQKLYTAFQKDFSMPSAEFRKFMEESSDESNLSSHMGTDLDKRIAAADNISKVVGGVVKQTINWPSLTQSFKGLLTAGPIKGVKYFMEKREKGKAKKQEDSAKTDKDAKSKSAGKND